MWHLSCRFLVIVNRLFPPTVTNRKFVDFFQKLLFASDWAIFPLPLGGKVSRLLQRTQLLAVDRGTCFQPKAIRPAADRGPVTTTGVLLMENAENGGEQQQQQQQRDPLLNARDRLFHTLFFRVALGYARYPKSSGLCFFVFWTYSTDLNQSLYQSQIS